MKIWHDSTEEDVPKKHKLCLLALRNDFGGFAHTRFDFGYIVREVVGMDSHFWQAHASGEYRLDDVEQWAYLDDLLNCDNKDTSNSKHSTTSIPGTPSIPSSPSSKEHFTPGPWKSNVLVCPPNITFTGIVLRVMARIDDETEKDVCFVCGREMGNAALIAAAPEMYEALKGLVDIFPSLNIEVNKPVLERTPVWRNLCHILCSADEALKKARGEN